MTQNIDQLQAAIMFFFFFIYRGIDDERKVRVFLTTCPLNSETLASSPKGEWMNEEVHNDDRMT